MKRYIVKQSCYAMLKDFNSTKVEGIDDNAFSNIIPKGVYSEKDFKALLGDKADEIIASKGFAELKNFIDVEEVKDVSNKVFKSSVTADRAQVL